LQLDASFATKRRRWPWAFFRAGPRRPRRLHVVLPLLKFALVNIVLKLDASFATKRRRWPWAFFRAGPWRPRQLHGVLLSALVNQVLHWPGQVRFLSQVQEFHVVLLLHVGTLVNQVLQLDASFATKRRRWPWAFFRAGPRRPRRLHVVLPLLKFALVNIVLKLDASFATKRRRWPWAFFRAGPWRPRQLHVVLLLHISTLVNQVVHLAKTIKTRPSSTYIAFGGPFGDLFDDMRDAPRQLNIVLLLHISTQVFQLDASFVT